MQQQINLYQPIFRKEHKLFSALTLLYITLASLGLMVLIGVYFQVQLYRLQANENALSNQYQRLNSTLEALRNTEGDPELEAMDQRIARLEETLDTKEALLADMATLTGAGRGGFSSLLTALGRQRLDGLWLTGVRLGDSGRTAELRGIALDPRLVPRYLQLLPEEPRLQALDFRQIQISRNDQEPRRLDFTLQAGASTTGGTL